MIFTDLWWPRTLLWDQNAVCIRLYPDLDETGVGRASRPVMIPDIYSPSWQTGTLQSSYVFGSPTRYILHCWYTCCGNRQLFAHPLPYREWSGGLLSSRSICTCKFLQRQIPVIDRLYNLPPNVWILCKKISLVSSAEDPEWKPIDEQRAAWERRLHKSLSCRWETARRAASRQTAKF